MKNKNNIAFIDGQNLHMGTEMYEKKVDFKKLNKYLNDKYSIKKSYYFIGVKNHKYKSLYQKLSTSGYDVVFREHIENMAGPKKGNVDSDIVFEIMKNLIETKNMNKIVLISGDGDYIKTVKYLILKDRLQKVIFPNSKFSSSLYNQIENRFKVSLSRFYDKVKK